MIIHRKKDFLITQARVVGPTQIITADVLVLNGVIAEINKSISDPPNVLVIDAEGRYLLPGFIDIHNHGAQGFDFSFGQYSVESDTFTHDGDAITSGLKAYLMHNLSTGTVLLYPTTMAAPLEVLNQSLEGLNSFLKEHEEWAELIGGVNIEGTFLKDPAYAGAQNPRFFYPPAEQVLDSFHHASGQRIKIVNIPPEHSDAGLVFTRQLTNRGVVVAGGHTAAYGDEYVAAVEAGLSLSVHFLNGPSRRSSKGFRQGGAEEIMLRADQVYLELICDGYHVHPAYVRDVIARKGVDKVIIITDSMFANRLPGLKNFSLFGLEGEVSKEADYLRVRGVEDTLFGSVLSMDVAYRNMLRWLTQPMAGVWHRHHKGQYLEEAIIHSSLMSSTNPARLLGRDDTCGSIEIGKKAALLVAEIQHGESLNFKLEHVLFPG